MTEKFPHSGGWCAKAYIRLKPRLAPQFLIFYRPPRANHMKNRARISTSTVDTRKHDTRQPNRQQCRCWYYRRRKNRIESNRIKSNQINQPIIAAYSTGKTPRLVSVTNGFFPPSPRVVYVYVYVYVRAGWLFRPCSSLPSSSLSVEKWAGSSACLPLCFTQVARCVSCLLRARIPIRSVSIRSVSFQSNPLHTLCVQ